MVSCLRGGEFARKMKKFSKSEIVVGGYGDAG